MQHLSPLTLCAMSLAFVAPAFAAPLTDEQRAAIESRISEYEPRMIEVAQDIWANPELGFLEFDTSALLARELEGHGFSVEEGIAGMPTAFVASRKLGEGPVIAILAEMDALPGFSQAAEPVQKELEGISSGHACGHHLFGAGSVAAAIGLADWAGSEGVGGEIRVYGAPAEEGGSGKAYLARSGELDDVDIVLHWHPSAVNSASQGASRSFATMASRPMRHWLRTRAALRSTPWKPRRS